MYDFSDVEVSQAIFESYDSKFGQALRSDVVLVGAGPSGLVAAWHLAEANFNVVVLEKTPQSRRWHLGRQHRNERNRRPKAGSGHSKRGRG